MDLLFTKIAYASLDSFLGKVNAQIVNPLITLLFALAVVFFLYGVLEFIIGQDNDEKKTSGKSHMLWGVVGLTIMIGVWTLLNIVLNTLNITYINPENNKVNLPDYNSSNTPSFNTPK